MNKTKAIMVVMNTLQTDARVQRAASSIQEICDLTVLGVGNDCGIQKYNQVLLDLKARNGVTRYFEYLRKVKKYLRNNDFQLFYAHDYFSAALVPWVKKHFHDKVAVYDSHELIFPAKGFTSSRRDKFFSYFEKQAIKYSDLIICASEERSGLMTEYYKMNARPLVIENISELPIIEDAFSEKLLKHCKSIIDGNDRVLVYAGVLSTGREIDKLIKIVCENNDTGLLIIGDGPDSERLKSIANRTIPGRYCFMGSIPYQYMGVLLQKCDIGYISYPTDSLNNTFCASNKIFEYASVGLPMISPENPTVRAYFDKYSIGVIDDDLGLAFASVKKDYCIFKQNCYAFINTHRWSAKADQLREAIKNVL